MMVDEHVEGLRGIRQLLAGGDVLSPAHVSRVLRELPGCEVINGYGPTENTTFTTCYRMKDEAEVGSSVAIGRAIANTQVYVLDGRWSRCRWAWWGSCMWGETGWRGGTGSSRS